ncbi:MAG: PQQ-binding-like beta-propeller repeat protein [Promethearchaeota archaeon]
MAVGDFNNDGIDDALAGSLDDNVYAIEGVNGTQLWSNTNPLDVFSVAVGDFNNDGIDDALAGSDNVYAIDGATGVQLWKNMDSEFILSVATGDLNNDGTIDALVGSSDDNVYVIDGATGIQLWNNTDASDNILTVAVGDFNNDGIDDALAGTADSDVYAFAGYPNIYIIPAGTSNFDIAETSITISVSKAVKISIERFNESPVPSSSDVPGLNIFLDISISDNSALNYLWVNVSYAQLDLGTLNVSDLRVYFYNETKAEWQQVEASGVDTTHQLIWGKTTHLSVFGIFTEGWIEGTTSTPAFRTFTVALSFGLMIIIFYQKRRSQRGG